MIAKTVTTPIIPATPEERALVDARRAVVEFAEALERLRRRKVHAGQRWADYCHERLGVPGHAHARAVELARMIKPRLSYKGEADPEAVAAAIPGWLEAIRQGPDDAEIPTGLLLRAMERPPKPEPEESPRERAMRQAYGHTYPQAAHAALMALTRARVEGGEHNAKRPPVSVRLPGDPYRVALHPRLESSPHGWRPTGVIRAEVFRDAGGFFNAAVRADLHPSGEVEPRRWKRDPDLTGEAFRGLVAALEAFAADPVQALAGGDHCALCGRALTDAASIARGIGPECYETAMEFTAVDQAEDWASV